jgi:hypothetical protein
MTLTAAAWPRPRRGRRCRCGRRVGAPGRPRGPSRRRCGPPRGGRTACTGTSASCRRRCRTCQRRLEVGGESGGGVRRSGRGCEAVRGGRRGLLRGGGRGETRLLGILHAGMLQVEGLIRFPTPINSYFIYEVHINVRSEAHRGMFCPHTRHNDLLLLLTHCGGFSFFFGHIWVGISYYIVLYKTKI